MLHQGIILIVQFRATVLICVTVAEFYPLLPISANVIRVTKSNNVLWKIVLISGVPLKGSHGSPRLHKPHFENYSSNTWWQHWESFRLDCSLRASFPEEVLSGSKILHFQHLLCVRYFVREFTLNKIQSLFSKNFLGGLGS